MWVDSLLTIHILWSISLDQPFQEGAGEHRRQRREHSDPNLDVEGSEREGVLRERGGREGGSPDGNFVKISANVARFRLYQNRSLGVNTCTRFSAFFKSTRLSS